MIDTGCARLIKHQKDTKEMQFMKPSQFKLLKHDYKNSIST